jgi:hypothetical protein
MDQPADLGAIPLSQLEHFGVKGMRWGVRNERAVTTRTHIDQGILRRKTRIEAKGGEGHDAHPDAIKAAIQKQKLKKSGTAALSTQELRDLANRLQVEGQVNAMIKSKGQSFIEGELTSKQAKAAGRRQVGKAAPVVIKRAKKTAATLAVGAML